MPIEQLNENTLSKTHRPLRTKRIDGNELHPIRLVTIKKGLDSEPIQCLLRTTTLEQSRGLHDALSYCWGCQEDPRRITLNGLPFMETQNLYEALLRIRSSEGDHVMWIDALCINQMDLAERNSQVKHMHRIYQSANRTIIWLGEITMKGQFFCDTVCDWPVDRNGIYQKLKSLGQEPAEYLLDFIDGLTDLCRCEYWTRVWIMQEIYHSELREILIMWGSRRVYYNVCFSGIRDDMVNDRNLTIACKNVLRQCGRLCEFASLQRSWVARGPQAVSLRTPTWKIPTNLDRNAYYLDTLGTQLSSMLGKFCSDHRDHVFGVYHIFPQLVQDQVPVDYGLSVEQIYLATTLAFILPTQRLAILATPRPRTWSSIHPSWVLDWSAPAKALHYDEWYGHKKGDHPKVYDQSLIAYLEASKILRITGMVIASVCKVYEPARVDAELLNTSRQDQLLHYHKQLMSCYDDLTGAKDELYNEKWLRYWFLVVSSLGARFDNALLEQIFEPNYTGNIPEECLEWLAMCY